MPFHLAEAVDHQARFPLQRKEKHRQAVSSWQLIHCPAQQVGFALLLAYSRQAEGLSEELRVLCHSCYCVKRRALKSYVCA